MFQIDKKHQKYHKYNPTNIDWIGDIPDGWEVKKIKHVSEITLGKMLQNEDGNGRYLRPYLRSQNITWIRPDIADVKEMYFSENELLRLRLKKGDLLVSEGGEVGRTCLWDNEIEECYIQNSVNRVRVKKYNNSKFILYSFFVYGDRGVFDASVNRVSIAHLTREKLKEISIVSPSFEEQQEIATYLDEKTALLDEAVAKKKKQIELLAEHRTALINNAITKGLDPNVEMKDSGIDWIGEIPKGWEVKKIKYLGKTFNGATPKSEVIEYWDGNIVWATPEDLSRLVDKYICESKRTITEQGYQSCGTSIVPENSIILSCRAPIGLLAINKVPMCSNQGCKSIIPNSRTHYTFLYYSLLANKSRLDAMGSGTTFKELSSKKLADFLIAIPTLLEQKEITDYLDKETKYIDDMIAKIEKSIELLEEYKTSLISHVVSGKIRVS